MRFNLRVPYKLAAVAAAVIILASAFPTITASGHAIVEAETGPATLVLSHNGKVLATYHPLCGPNLACSVLEFDWKAGSCPAGVKAENPPVVVSFSTAGQYDGKPALAPCVNAPSGTQGFGARHDINSGANDVEYAPGPPGPNGAQDIMSSWWTRNGVMISRIAPPQTTVHMRRAAATPPDAIHIYLSYGPKEHLTAIKLKNGNVVSKTIKVPTGTNQVDAYGYVPKTGAAGTGIH